MSGTCAVLGVGVTAAQAPRVMQAMAVVPFGAFGGLDNDVPAANQAS